MSDNKVRKKIRGIQKGINTYTANYDLPDNELEIIENWDINEAGYDGVLRKRYGYDRISSNQVASGGTGVGSAFESTINLSGTATDLIVANIINGGSSGLYYNTSPYTGTWTAITGANGANQGYKLNYASFKDKVYIANRNNGAVANEVWDGTTTGIYEMGCPPCNGADVTLAVGTASGGLTAGSAYIYMITFLYDGFQESGAFSSTSNLVAPVAGSINLSTIPVSSNSRCTARKIYRTKAGGGTSYYYLTTINDNTTTTYTDIIADNLLVEPREYSNILALNKPQYSKYVTIHKERSVLANLKESFFTTLVSGDITLTASNGAGTLTGSTTYNYRFYKIYVIDATSPVYYAVPVLSKSVTMGASDDTVTIHYAGADPFVKYIAVERASAGVGSTDYKLISGSSPNSLLWNTSADYTDLVPDGSRTVYTVQNVSAITMIDTVGALYPFNVKISDAGKPDIFSNIETAQDGTLIPASNEWNVGETITGIHSEDNRIVIFGQNNIYELDTTAQSRQFWRLNKIVSGTGSKDGLQCQTSEGYFFLTEYTDSIGLQILQYNRGQITDVGNLIRSYCLNNGIITFNEIKYYDTKREVWIIAETASKTYILKYKLDTGQWRVDVNTTTDLNFNVLCPTKNNRMLIGGGDGYVHRQTTSVLQDKIAGALTSFTTKAKTKHFNEEDADISPRRFLATLVTSGGSTSTALVRYANADGTEYTSNLANDQAGTTDLPDGVHRLRTASFNDAVKAPKPDIYFQLETTNSKFEVLKNMTVELEVKHGASGGK